MKKMVPVLLSYFLSGTTIASVTALSVGIGQIAYAQQTDFDPVYITVSNGSMQTFEGFGVSIGNPIGEFVPKGGRKDVANTTACTIYNRLFKKDDPNSLNLTFLRLPILTSNYKTSSSAGYDFNTAFKKTGEKDIINAARKSTRNPNIKIMFTPWTPPYWMKDNYADYNADAYSTDPESYTTNRLNPSNYGAYASLLKKWCDDFNNDMGFPIYSLSLQNEPDLDISYSSCLFRTSDYRNLLTAVRSTIPWGYPTQLWGPEATSNMNSYYIGNITTAGLLDAAAAHSYNGDVGALEPWARNNLKVHMTEYSASYEPTYQGNQQLIAADVINRFCKDANNGKVSSWFFWNAVAVDTNLDDNKGVNIGESLIIGNDPKKEPNTVYKRVIQTASPGSDVWIVNRGVYNLNNNTDYPVDTYEYATPDHVEFSNITLTPLYYAFRRLTLAVKPNSVARWTTVSPNFYEGASPQDDVYAASFRRPDGKFCVVVANKSTTKSWTGILNIQELNGTGSLAFDTYYTSIDTAPVNDVSWTTYFTNGHVNSNLYSRSVTIFVQR